MGQDAKDAAVAEFRASTYAHTLAIRTSRLAKEWLSHASTHHALHYYTQSTTENAHVVFKDLRGFLNITNHSQVLCTLIHILVLRLYADVDDSGQH